MNIGEFAGLEGPWYDDFDRVIPIPIAKVRFAGSHAARPADTVINIDATDGQRFQLHFTEDTLESLVSSLERLKKLRAQGRY